VADCYHFFMTFLKKIKSTQAIDFYSSDTSTELELPFVKGGISAGFPSPANDYLDLSLDLNKTLVKNPSATFYGRVKGASMRDAGVSDGDVIIIDKTLEPRDGTMAVCFIDGDFTLKRIRKDKARLFLVPANGDYKPIEVTSENDFIVWGVVTYIIKKV